MKKIMIADKGQYDDGEVFTFPLKKIVINDNDKLSTLNVTIHAKNQNDFKLLQENLSLLGNSRIGLQGRVKQTSNSKKHVVDMVFTEPQDCSKMADYLADNLMIDMSARDQLKKLATEYVKKNAVIIHDNPAGLHRRSSKVTKSRLDDVSSIALVSLVVK